MLDELIQRSGSYGTKEVVIGMAHRGRLNVLVNTFGKNPRELFDEFEGKKKVELGSGDVKYHQGFSSNVMTTGGEVHLAMAFNPSHLEIVSRWSKVRFAPVRIVATTRPVTRFCRSPSTVTRHSPVRAWSWKPSRCRRPAVSRPAVPCTS
jgi:2-oxoglutarate dehydrogenase E1 component